MSKSALFSLLFLLCAPTLAAAIEDPMRPVGVSAAKGARVAATKSAAAPSSKERFTLSSTLIQSGRQAAIINGVRVLTGDTVDGFSVEEILPNQVRLKRASQELTIRLLPSSIKQPIKEEL